MEGQTHVQVRTGSVAFTLNFHSGPHIPSAVGRPLCQALEQKPSKVLECNQRENDSHAVQTSYTWTCDCSASSSPLDTSPLAVTASPVCKVPGELSVHLPGCRLAIGPKLGQSDGLFLEFCVGALMCCSQHMGGLRGFLVPRFQMLAVSLLPGYEYIVLPLNLSVPGSFR